MQPDRGMIWQAENSELAREFPAGTASKARQSRLHQAQGFFPVFVFHSFVQFLNINVPKGQRSVKVNVGGKSESRRQMLLGWHLPPTVYVSCTCPNFSLFKRMNH